MASVIRGSDNFDSSATGPSTTFADVGTYAFASIIDQGATTAGTTRCLLYTSPSPRD